MPQHSYDSFLATLAAVTGTVVTVLLGFAGAYYVFLRDRASQFDDEATQHRLIIRDTLTQLRIAWPTPPVLMAYLPPDFEGSVRDTYPSQPSVDMLGRLAADLEFEDPRLKTLVTTQLVGTYTGAWKGRIYYWLLGQTVTALANRGPSLQSFPPQPPPPTVPSRAFPLDASGPGFAEWRSSYATISAWTHFFLDYRSAYEADFASFTERKFTEKQSDKFNRNFNASVGAFFRAIDILDKEVDATDRANLLRERYSGSRIGWKLILGLSGLALLTGMVGPLIMLALPGMHVTRLTVLLMLGATVLSLAVSGMRLACGVAANPELGGSAYLAERWYRPLLGDIGVQVESARRVGMVDIGAYDDAVRFESVSRLPGDLDHIIREVIRASTELNRATTELNAIVVKALETDRVIGQLFGPPQPIGGPLLSTLGLADGKLFADWRRGYGRPGLAGIPIEFEGPNWSRVMGFIEAPKTEEEKRSLIEGLEAVHDRVRVSREFTEFQRDRAHALEVLQALRERLAKLLQAG